MACKIQYVVAPNGEMSTLFEELLDVTSSQERALRVYLDSMDIDGETNKQGDLTIDEVIRAGLLEPYEIARYQRGGYQRPIEDDIIKNIKNQIDNSISAIERQINPSLPEGEKEDLRQQIRELENDKERLADDSLPTVKSVANRHFDWAKKLMNDPTVSSRKILQAIRLMDLWNTDTTFQFLNKTQRGDEGNSYNKTFSELGKQAFNVQIDLYDAAWDRISEESQTPREELSNIQELGRIKQQFFDQSRIDQSIARHHDTILKNAERKRDTILKDLAQKLSEYEEDIDPQVLLRKDENGDPIDEFLAPFTQEYMEERSSILRVHYNKIDAVDNDKRGKVLGKTYKKLNDIEILIDPNKLDDLDRAKKELMDQGVEESIAEYAVEQAKMNLEKYKKALAEFKSGVQADINSGLWQEKSLEGETSNEYRERVIRNYQKNNSPYLYYQDRNKKTPEFTYNHGYKYTYSLPETGKGYYSEDFQNLSDREREMWDFITSVISSGASFLPNSLTRGLDKRFLPNINKTFVEHWNSNGFGYAVGNTFNDFLDDIRSLEEQTLTEEQENLLNVFKGPADRDTVPIMFLGDSDLPKQSISSSIRYLQNQINDIKNKDSLSEEDKIEIEELENRLEGVKSKKKDKSLDVIRATQMFVSMALNYRDMTNVAAEAELVHRLVSEKEGGGGRLSEAIRQQINYLVYSVSKQEGKDSAFTITDDPRKSISTHRRKMELENKRDELEDQLANGEINQKQYENRMAPLAKEYKELGGRSLVWSKFIDNTLLPYAQLKGMGLNVGAAFRNIGYGILANLIHSASGEEFTDRQFIQAFRIMLQNVGKNGKVKSLVDKFGILYEVADIEVGKDRQFDGFNPYYLQSITEYFGQGLTMVATMLNTTVTDVEGNERNLYEAYDDKGNWKTEEFGDERDWRTAQANKELQDEDGEKFKELRNKIRQLNARIHGDYNKDSQQIFKRTVIGRLISMFRTWVPEALAYRFGKKQPDHHLGRDIIGSYRGTALAFRDNHFGETMKYLTQSFIPFVKPGSDTIPEIQQKAIRRMMREMQIYSALGIVALGLKAGIDDDEEMNSGRKVLLNNLLMLQQDIGLYLGPGGLIQLAKNPVPAVSVYNDYQNAMIGTQKYLTEDGYQGDHPIWKWTKATPVLKQMNTLRYQGETIIE